MSEDNGSLDWQRKSECSKPENKQFADSFFSADPDKKYEAKNLCFKCDVRAECVTWAMENKEIWGVWGGRDENETRRNLSVNSEGVETRRQRYPQCPYCAARTSQLSTKIVDLPDGGRWTTARMVECNECGFEWRSRSSANAVTAYFVDRDDRAARARKILVKSREKKDREKEREREKIERDRLRDIARETARIERIRERFRKRG